MPSIILNLNIDNQVLNQITVKEYVNVNKLNKIINSNVLCDINWDGFKHEKDQLTKLKSQVKNSHTEIKFNAKVGFGRVYPMYKKISLGTLRRRIRHTLCKEDYIDIDMVNAQPTIYNDILMDAGLKNECLNKYIKNRNDILIDIMNQCKCCKDQAKNLIISFINGGSLESWIKKHGIKPNAEKTYISKYIVELQEEIKKANKIIIASNNEAVEKLKKNKKDDYKGDHSFISYFLGEYEKCIIEFVILYLTKEGIIKDNVFIYCQDGIMILKKDFNINILREIEKQLLESYGFNIKFHIKEMDEAYTDEELYNDQINDQYTIIKSEFETTCFKLNNPLCYCREIDNGLQFFTETEIKLYLADKYFKGFYDVWKPDQQKRHFEKIVFDPSNKDEINYNLFKGFKYDDDNVDDFNTNDCLFLQLLKHVCITEDIYTYFLDWVCRIIQQPYRKTEWAIVLYSHIGGIGKNAIIDCLFKLFDAYAGSIQDIEDITKKFNSNLCNKLFIYGDEITARAKTLSNQLKNVITRKVLHMEKKGVDPIQLNDYSNYIFTTNNEHCFQIDEDDRRFFMIKCTDERKTDKFFNDYYDEIKNELKLKQLFKYLKNRKIEYELNKAPITNYKMELMIEHKPAYIQMLYKKPHMFKERNITSTKLLELSQEYAKKNFLTSNYTITKFGKDIKPFINIFRKKVNGNEIYKFPSDTIELKKHLFNLDQKYYRYVNGFEDNEEVNFEEDDDYITESSLF